MRVTSNTFPQSLVRQLSELAQTQNRLQNQAATGQRIQNPEDDPTAVRRVMSLREEAQSNVQYQRNIDRQYELSNANVGLIRSLKIVSDRANEIATQADGTATPDAMRAYGEQVNQLIEQALQQANQKNRGDHLLAGTVSENPPFVAERDAEGRVTNVTYQGNSKQSESEIAPGVRLSSKVVGANTSGSGPRGLLVDSRHGADFLQHLIDFRDQLEVGDVDSIINDTRKKLEADEDNIVYHMGAQGATQARLEATRSVLKERSFEVEKHVSKEVDADLAETLVLLGQVQNAYRAALQSGGSVLNTSLLDYIR